MLKANRLARCRQRKGQPASSRQPILACCAARSESAWCISSLKTPASFDVSTLSLLQSFAHLNRKIPIFAPTKMSNKDRVCIEVFHRDEQTLLEIQRQNPQGMEIYRRYHWAILIRPKDTKKLAQSASFDITDGVRQAPDRNQDLNPTRDWWFRVKTGANPLLTGRFLVAVCIGKLPKGVTMDEIENLLSEVPLPRKDTNPEQRCSYWTAMAVMKLQKAGFVVDKDVKAIMNAVLKAGDHVFKNGAPSNAEDRFPDISQCL